MPKKRWAQIAVPEERMVDAVRAILKSPPDETITLTLDHNEAQAILNALRESGVLDKPTIFQHVAELRRKTAQAMVAAGYRPL